MKYFLNIIPLIFCFSLNSQDDLNVTSEKVFVRIYDLQGYKMGKGKIRSVTGTMLYIGRIKNPRGIPIRKIGHIKTKRSGCRNIFVFTAIGISITLMNDELHTVSDKSIHQLVIPYYAGILVGIVTAIFKNSKKYIINGDLSKWNEIKNIIGK